MDGLQYMDAARLIPVDVDAEESLAGWAIVDAGKARHINGQVGPAEFHDPRCLEVIGVAAATPQYVDNDDDWDSALEDGHRLVVHGCAKRASAIRHETGLPWAWLTDIVEHRSLADIDGLIRRVVDAAEHRYRRRQLVAELDELGVDTRLLTNLDAVLTEAQYGVLRVATAIRDAISGTGSDTDVAEALGRLGVHFGMTTDQLTRALTPQEDTDG